MSKKTIKIIVSVLLVFALAFAVYWTATEDERYIRGELQDIQEQVERFRAGNRSSFDFSFLDEVAEDPRLEELMITLVKEMCVNREDKMLVEFLDRVEFTDFFSENLIAVLHENLGASGDLEFVFAVMDSYEFESGLKYYNKGFSVHRDQGFLAAYIAEHGTQSFTTTPGEGYYANEEDSYDKDVVGLPQSPLYDAKTVTHMGDFKCVHSYGVKLNSYYEETSYSRYSFYFRDEYISFDPDAGEVVWSGDYLFCFDSSGYLIAFTKL